MRSEVGILRFRLVLITELSNTITCILNAPVIMLFMFLESIQLETCGITQDIVDGKLVEDHLRNTLRKLACSRPNNHDFDSAVQSLASTTVRVPSSPSCSNEMSACLCSVLEIGWLLIPGSLCVYFEREKVIASIGYWIEDWSAVMLVVILIHHMKQIDGGSVAALIQMATEFQELQRS